MQELIFVQNEAFQLQNQGASGEVVMKHSQFGNRKSKII